MRKIFNANLFLAIFVFAIINPVFAEDNNFLGGIIHTQVTSDFSSNTAGMAAIEAGRVIIDSQVH